LRKAHGVLAVFIILSTCLAHSQTSSLKIQLDPAQTEIHWKVSAGLGSIRGTFKLKNGEFVLNPTTGLAEGEVLVDATTGDTGNPARNKQVQDVLESNRYPGIFFHPTGIKGGFPAADGVQQLSAEGTFNIHGADHPLQLPLKVQIASGAMTATARFTVPYVAWGMKYPGTLFHRVGKQVEVEITAKGKIQKEE
jgi:polyisoprenoid-binding protein YceI